MMRTNTARVRQTLTGQRLVLAVDHSRSRESRDAIARWVEANLLNVVVGIALGLGFFFGVLRPAIDAAPSMLLPAHVVAASEAELARVQR